jgi:putative transposase
MPEYRRANVAGGTYFFTVVTYARRPVLTTETARMALREAIGQARTTLPFEIEAWVLLPDHLHCIWVLPPGDANFSARWAIIKRHVSRRCEPMIGAVPSFSRRRRRERSFWQRRFWEHQIRDHADLGRHLDYIHWNPVKHGLARAAEDWPYSTFHRYVKAGVYPCDWGGNGAEDADGDFGE